MMPKNLVCTREQSLLRSVFAILLFVVDEGGRARVGRFKSFSLAIGGDGRADLGHGGCKVVRGVNEGGAGVPMGMHTNSTRPQYRRRALSKGGTCRSS